jgi:ketosteroid isomerase-like protein
MNRRRFQVIASLGFALILVLDAAWQAQAQDANSPYPSMAPLDQYLIADRNDEKVLARSATPEAISRGATVLVPGRQGYEIAVKGKLAGGPTAESVMAAEDELTRAMRDNDADGIARCLSEDWAVISARGGVGEGKSIFPDGIKTGHLKHTAYEVSEPRVRLYGDMALVTTKVHNAGLFNGKPFDVMERQTDVWLWKDGGWKCVLTHEAWEGAEKDQKVLSR